MERIPELYKYRHVSFDLWLTLIKSNPQFKSKRDILFKDFFSIDKSIDEVSAVIRKFDVLTNSINEKVCRNFDTYEIYYLILNALDVDIETISADKLPVFYKETELLFNEYKPILLSDSIPDSLSKIYGEGITLNILSNTAFIKGSTLRGIISHYGMEDLFSFQAYSDETGFSKPGTEMYNYAYDNILKIGDIQKNEILHVGDNLVSDYNGAKNFGFNAFLITNNHNEHNLQPA
ncbi:HAD family hydrolase [Flavobacterium sp. DG1-102-2]|uniref:HAD family hydrolase n=1 Tax=Flavobacterium sp. DG1-102-2 TaxID=3081663 RepID=UPI0029498820|nr:HAD family hydrolase [Flavobacterium sp. DG1-102-2]MDV6167230.1 HAD family hydrolase [Flavobacterium sp. DG1-102-2]